MTVFHYEWKRSRKYILIWGLSLAVCIFSMIPVYYSMIETPELLPKNFAEGGFFETVGISLALLLEPLGLQKNVPKTQQNTCSQNPAGVFKFIKERCFVYLSAHALRVLHISLRLL